MIPIVLLESIASPLCLHSLLCCSFIFLKMQFESDAALKEYMESSGRSFISLTFLEGDELDLGKIVFELFTDLCPRTCDNFIRLVNATHASKYQYKGSPIHRVVQHAYIQGGDVVDGTGKGDPRFHIPDESFGVKHDEEGILGMASNGEAHTGASQFYVTLNPLSWLDGKKVAFGKVLTAEGLEVLKKIGAGGLNNERPLPEVVISHAAVLHIAEQ